jgi:hypothetical protein
MLAAVPSQQRIITHCSAIEAIDDPDHTGWLSGIKPLIECVAPGFIGVPIGTKTNYAIGGQLLALEFFTRQALRSTIRDGNHPPGSTELDDATGQNAYVTQEQFQAIMIRCFGAHSAHYPRTLDYLLNVTIWNLAAINQFQLVRRCNIPGDKIEFGRLLAFCVIMFVGACATTPKIFEESIGQDPALCTEIGGERGDIAVLTRLSRCMHKVVTNHLYLWQRPSYGHEPVLTQTFIDGLPPSLIDMMAIYSDDDSLTFVRQPIPSGEGIANILMQRLRESKHNPEACAVFEDKVIQWYTDFFVNHDDITDETGIDNGIFAAFGVEFED